MCSFMAMNIEVIFIGKNKKKYLEEACSEFIKRFPKYASVKISYLKAAENLESPALIKKKEGTEILQHLHKNDYLILLDERGKSYRSIDFAQYIQKISETYSSAKICFLVGGAYGFSKEVYDRAQAKISLSDMTMSHQLVRLIFLEQLYRAFTILKGEAYHHED